MNHFKNMKWWQVLILGVMAVLLGATTYSTITSNISNATLRVENKKLVKEKFNALEAKEDYWRGVDKAYQDTMRMYRELQDLSTARADSIREARKQIQLLKDNQYEIVRNFNDTTRGSELDRIIAKHDI